MGYTERISVMVVAGLWLLSIPGRYLPIPPSLLKLNSTIATNAYSNCSFSYYTKHTDDLAITIFSISSLPVTSQEDLDNRTAGCATIFGDIQIYNSYTGSVVLHIVTNITGNLFADLYYDDKGEVTSSGPPLLTSVECPELVTVGGDVNLRGF